MNIDLFVLQAVHSGIFLICVAATTWLWICLLRPENQNRYTFYSVIWLAIIGFSLLLNRGVCPLQDLARWVESSDIYVKDMLTPVWFNNLAVPVIAPPAFLGILGIVLRALHGRMKTKRGRG